MLFHCRWKEFWRFCMKIHFLFNVLILTAWPSSEEPFPIERLACLVKFKSIVSRFSFRAFNRLVSIFDCKFIGRDVTRRRRDMRRGRSWAESFKREMMAFFRLLFPVISSTRIREVSLRHRFSSSKVLSHLFHCSSFISFKSLFQVSLQKLHCVHATRKEGRLFTQC